MINKELISNILKRNKKIIIFLLVSVCAIIFIYNDSFLYNKTVIKVINQNVTKKQSVTDYFGKSENVYTQECTAKIKNGSDKGEIITFENKYAYSEIVDNKYQKGDFLIVNQNTNGTISIISLKRDYLIASAILLFIAVLIFIGKRKGLFTLISLLINISITILVVFLYTKGMNLIPLSAFAILVFIIITALLINGKNKKTYASIISTIFGLALSCFITFLVMKLADSKGVYFEQMQFVLKNAVQLFYIQIIVGSLGGIMDICVSLSSAIYEIMLTNPSASFIEVKKSAKTISSDIIGTMTSTVLFAYIAGNMPMFLLLIKNNYSFTFIYENCLNLEIIRALTCCIGMVIAIPLSILVSISLFRKKDAKI